MSDARYTIDASDIPQISSIPIIIKKTRLFLTFNGIILVSLSGIETNSMLLKLANLR